MSAYHGARFLLSAAAAASFPPIRAPKSRSRDARTAGKSSAHQCHHRPPGSGPHQQDTRPHAAAEFLRACARGASGRSARLWLRRGRADERDQWARLIDALRHGAARCEVCCWWSMGGAACRRPMSSCSLGQGVLAAAGARAAVQSRSARPRAAARRPAARPGAAAPAARACSCSRRMPAPGSRRRGRSSRPGCGAGNGVERDVSPRDVLRGALCVHKEKAPAAREELPGPDHPTRVSTRRIARLGREAGSASHSLNWSRDCRGSSGDPLKIFSSCNQWFAVETV